MATKKQKREAGAKKHAERVENDRKLGLLAQQYDREQRAYKLREAELEGVRIKGRFVDLANTLEGRTNNGKIL